MPDLMDTLFGVGNAPKRTDAEDDNVEFGADTPGGIAVELPPELTGAQSANKAIDAIQSAQNAGPELMDKALEHPDIAVPILAGMGPLGVALPLGHIINKAFGAVYGAGANALTGAPSFEQALGGDGKTEERSPGGRVAGTILDLLAQAAIMHGAGKLAPKLLGGEPGEVAAAKTAPPAPDNPPPSPSDIAGEARPGSVAAERSVRPPTSAPGSSIEADVGRTTAESVLKQTGKKAPGDAPVLDLADARTARLAAREAAAQAAHVEWKRKRDAYDPRRDEALQGPLADAEHAAIQRGDVAGAAVAHEQARLEAERVPAKSALDYASDSASAAARARVLDLGGDDMPVEPAVDAPPKVLRPPTTLGVGLGGAAEQLKETASHFQFHPKLEDYLLKPGYSVADAVARLHTANASEPWLATRETKSILRDTPLADKVQAWLTGSQTKEGIAVRQYVTAADNIENLNRGQTSQSGLSGVGGRQALQAQMAQAEAAIGAPRMAELVKRIRDINDTSFAELLAAGKVQLSDWRPDYIRNIFTDKAKERMTAIGGKAPGQFGGSAPGASKARHGYEGDLEDPISATAFGRYEAGKAYNFAKTIRDPVVQKFSMNRDIRQNPAGAIAGDTVLFTFDDGVQNRIINQYDTRRILAGLNPHQLNPAAGSQPFELPGPRGPVKYDAMPGRLAEGLDEAMSNAGEFGKVAHLMSKGNQIVTTGLLSFPVTNLPYEINQLMSDTRSAFESTAGLGTVLDIASGKGPRIAAKETFRAALALAKEYAKVFWLKERPTLLRDLARQNLYGVNWESMYEDVTNTGPGIARVVSENSLPLHEQGKGSAVKAVLLSIQKLTDLWGKTRESVLAQGIAKAKEDLTPGMSREGSVAAARQAMGGYDKKSPAGRLFAMLSVFHKWFLNAEMNVTTRVMKDPLTKKWGGWKRLPAGVQASPLIGVGIAWATIKMWNRGVMGAWGRKVEDEVLPSAQAYGIVMPFTDKGEYVGPGARLKGVTGRPVIVEPESNLQIVAANVGGAKDMVTGQVGSAVEDAVRFVGSRGAPFARAPFEALLDGQIKSGSPVVPPDFAGSSNERQVRELSRRGVPWAGLLGRLPIQPFKSEYLLENLSYAPSFIRHARDVDQTAWERAQAFGSPFRVVKPQAAQAENKTRSKQEIMAALDAVLLNPKHDPAAVRALTEELRAIGADPAAAKGQISRWQNATAAAEKLTRDQKDAKRFRGMRNPTRDLIDELFGVTGTARPK